MGTLWAHTGAVGCIVLSWCRCSLVPGHEARPINVTTRLHVSVFHRHRPVLKPRPPRPVRLRVGHGCRHPSGLGRPAAQPPGHHAGHAHAACQVSPSSGFVASGAYEPPGTYECHEAAQRSVQVLLRPNWLVQHPTCINAHGLLNKVAGYRVPIDVVCVFCFSGNGRNF